MTIFIAAARAVARAPLADDEVERHQHQVEEQDEQRQVLGHERAEHGGLAEREVEAKSPRVAPAAARSSHRAEANDDHAVSGISHRFRPSTPSL